MTNDEIDKLEAGREMDALIARLMEWKIANDSEPDNVIYSDKEGQIWMHPSADIESAWQVVEKMRPTHGIFIDGDGDPAHTFNYEVDFQHGMVGSPEYSKGTAKAETAPLAICRAALKAMSAR